MTSTTRNILIGLALGVATGLFLGEKAGAFQLVAEAYLRLLQMTVLPYVMVSLIEGIGSLDGARARRLFVRVGTLSLLLWALAIGAVMLMPLAFPEIESASFFSTTLVEARPPLDFVALYIPSNPGCGAHRDGAQAGSARKPHAYRTWAQAGKRVCRQPDAHRAVRYRGTHGRDGGCRRVRASTGLSPAAGTAVLR